MPDNPRYPDDNSWPASDEYGTYTQHDQTDFMTPDLTRYWLDRRDHMYTAMSPNEGAIGTYNAQSNITLDHNGDFVGLGNWLPTLFGRK